MKKQLAFQFRQEGPRRFFGGRLLHNKRRGLRPLATKESIHLVMRSSWAVGENSFRHSRHRAAIHSIVDRMARRFGVRIYRKALMGNHIHLVLRVTNRLLFRKFIRAVSGMIAGQVMGGERFDVFRTHVLRKGGDAPGEVQGRDQNFWQFRPFTRLISWGRDFRYACDYVSLNIAEALGFVAYRPRQNRYTRWIKETVEIQV